ncbi:MarR family winged helix-turn-helix transcriptional regulator [Paucilactobacillus sp. N302-9]|jgi:DNA-binding MarR family transcriptional regulator
MTTPDIRLDNQLCFQINRAHQLFNRFYQEPLSEFGLTYVQYTVLLALWEKDSVTVNEVGQKVGLGTGTLTPLLKRMEKANWISRTRCLEDERRVIVKLSDQAKAQKGAILNATKACIDQLQYNDTSYADVMGAIHDVQKRLEHLEKVKKQDQAG